MNNINDTTFSIDKYGNPKLLSLKDSVANAVVNVCFMKPGNIPGLPHLGVDIRQYFYKTQEELEQSSSIVSAKIQEACGQLISGANISGVNFTVQKANNGEYVFLLIVRISFPDEGEQVLGVIMKNSNDKITFNYEYMNLTA